MGSITRAKIIRDDVALYDGVNKTYQRTDATGGTVTGLVLNDFVDVLQVFGSGSSRTIATITAAKNGVGTNICTFLFSVGTWTIDDDVTIPATIANYIPAGCTFSVSSGKTLTFSGPVHVEYSASDGTGWYSGDGDVVCSVGASGFPGW